MKNVVLRTDQVESGWLRALIAGILVFLVSLVALSDEIDFTCQNCEITELLSKYSAISKEDIFVVDPSVRGKVSILATRPVSKDEAHDLLKDALELNGYGIQKKEGRFVVTMKRRIEEGGKSRIR